MKKHYYQDQLDQILSDLDAVGVVPLFVEWREPYILDIIFSTHDDYITAYNLMRMECPTEVSSSYGLPSDLCLTFQFDRY